MLEILLIINFACIIFIVCHHFNTKISNINKRLTGIEEKIF